MKLLVSFWKIFTLVFLLVMLTASLTVAAPLGQTPVPLDPAAIALMTVAAVLNWLLTFGIGAAVSYVTSWFPDVPKAVTTLIGVFVFAGATGVVVYVQTQLTPDQLNMTVLQVFFAVGAIFVNWVGQLYGRNLGLAARTTYRTLKPGE